MIYGVTRTIHPSGPLSGLLGGRFFLAYLACTFHGLAKAVIIGFVVLFVNLEDRISMEKSTAIGYVSSLFLPQFLMALYSTIGFSVNSFKTIFHHIELLLLPSGNSVIFCFLCVYSNQISF